MCRLLTVIYKNVLLPQHQPGFHANQLRSGGRMSSVSAYLSSLVDHQRTCIAPIARYRQKYVCLASLVFLCATSTCVADTNDLKESAVVDSSASIALDGRLNEPVWRNAPVLKLVQQSPKPGEPTPLETEVRVVGRATTR